MNRTLLFPTPIWTDNFSDIDNDKILDFANSQKETNCIKVVPFADGYRTTGKEIFDEQLLELRTRVEKNLATIFTEMQFKQDHELSLVAGWIYFTKKGEFHPPHYHEKGMISCCYYIDVPEDSYSSLTIDDQRHARVAREGNPYESENALNNRRYFFMPKTRDFIAFPSWIQHYVTPSQSEEERIMITLDYNLVKK